MKANSKILVICGLTASGKTSLALKIAKKIGNTSIISADSRQAYQGLPIITGQDIPSGFIRYQCDSCQYQQLPGVYFSNGPVNIWGVDQIPPTQIMNISTFTKFVWKIIKKETLKGRRIIIVGGSGLYLKAITEPLLDIHSGFSQELRDSLVKLPVEELQKTLASLNSKKLKSMNQSDRSNPRRLIRAIEILKAPNPRRPAYLDQQKDTRFRWVGLKPDLAILKKNIHARVLKRLEDKAIDEVKSLKKIQKDQRAPIYSALGLTPILKYLRQEISKKELIKLWIKEDLSFAKRQLTWFKKQSSIIWYDQNSDQTQLIQSLSLWLSR